jgi:hypothetical protein
MPNVAKYCLFLLFSSVLLVVFSNCSARQSWVRSDLFTRPTVPGTLTSVDATIYNVAYLGGVQRGLNINLDRMTQTTQGMTREIYLEQPTQLPISITLMKRVRVYFDTAGEPVYLEPIVIAPTVDPAIAPQQLP